MNCPNPKKNCFNSEQEALKFIARTNLGVVPYPCKCGKWHTTKNLSSIKTYIKSDPKLKLNILNVSSKKRRAFKIAHLAGEHDNSPRTRCRMCVEKRKLEMKNIEDYAKLFRPFNLVQTRSEQNGIVLYASVSKAIIAAAIDSTIWKISWQTVDDRRHRFIKMYDNTWEKENLPGF